MSGNGFDFADVVDEAVLRSGGQTATAADVLNVRRSLPIITERWLARGYNTWRIRNRTFAINGASPTIRLPTGVDDVIQVNAVWNNNSETPMRRISAVEYAKLTTKLTTGSPAQFWLDRKATPELNIYPVGKATGTNAVKVYYMERPEEFNRYGADHSDIPGRWLEAMILGLAHDLARKRPPFDEGLIARLNTESKEAEALAQSSDRDRARYRYRI